MLIGILSDTHDNLPMIRKALEVFGQRNVDAILHAGDYVAPFAAKLLKPPLVAEGVPVHCIYGNNDGERKGLAGVLPQIQDGPMRIELGGRTLVMHHALAWLGDDDKAGADVVIGGHTHEIVQQRNNGQLTLNPGECCGYLSGTGTVALLDTDSLAVEIVKLHDA